MTGPTLCYYVTGHGYGHAIRTVEILKALPSDIRIIVKTTAPERLFREGLTGRDLQVIESEYDCGSLQSDNLTVLPRETMRRYREINAQNKHRLTGEVEFLRREKVACVATDIAPFPLRAAKMAGVPGIAVSNFTWTDIYREYVETPDDAGLLHDMQEEYRLASLALITPLSVATMADSFCQVERVPLITRKGRNIRAELNQALRLPVGTHLALPYLGSWGLAIKWSGLGALRDWIFLTYDAPPIAFDNVRVLDRQNWAYADVAASVDVVLAKPGYGTVTECIANAVPLVYVPRRGFAEQQALVDGVQRWGGGVAITEDDFLSGRWGTALQAALESKPDSSLYATDGAEKIAQKLSDWCRAAN